MSETVIALEDVHKHFGKVEALRGVDFQVAAGEVFGFLGPNGAGKTTTIRVLLDFIKASRGRALVLGLDAHRGSVAIKKRVGFLPDTIHFGSGFTGQEFLSHLARLRGINGPPPLQRELLDRLELSSAALRRGVKGYSTGMAKKLALVQAIQHDPELLVLDEPTESLDPLIRQELFAFFNDLRMRGTTIFMSSHVLADVEEICERVALIRNGRIVNFGAVEDLRWGMARTMTVTLKNPDEPFFVVGARIVAREGGALRLSVEGDINDVIRGLAAFDLKDVVYERMSLEELFLSYYQGNDEGAGDA